MALDANCAHRDNKPFLRFLEQCEDLNERELQGIGRSIEACSSIGQSGTDPLYVALSQYVGRTGRRNTSEAFIKVLESKADPALGRLWPKMKSHGCGLRTFVATHAPSLNLFVDERDLDFLMATDGDWAKGLQQARRITSRSVAGDALFGFVLTLVSAEGVSDIMDTALLALNPSKATKATVSGIREAIADEMDEYLDAQTLPKVRTAIVEYMGVDVSIRVTSAEFELELRIASKIKTAALEIAKSGLARLPHENWLLPPVSDAEPWATDDFLTGPFKAARLFAQDIFRGREVCCISDIKKLIGSSAGELLRLDPTFVLELGFIEDHLSTQLASHIEHSIIACLPDEDHAVSLQECDARLEELMGTHACQCAERASQSQVEALKEAIAALRKSLPPAYELWCNDKFFTVALQRMQYFCRVAVGDFENNTGKEVVGKDAIRIKMTYVKKHQDEPDILTYASFDDFFKFPWLITAAEQRDVRVMVEKVMTRAQASSASSTRRPKKAAKPAPKVEPSSVGCARFF